MKDWKSKLQSKTFWLSLASAVVIALQCFGVKIDVPYVNEAISALCSVMIIVGIVKNDTITGEIEQEIIAPEIQEENADGKEKADDKKENADGKEKAVE